jgi:anaerobic magnesium-protoporphyrin IX monomethyl ester cyclase
MKPKINLIHPPQPDSIDDRLNPPLGLLYMAAVLEKHGFPVAVKDLSSIPEKQWAQEIGDADIYGVTFYTCAIELVRKIAKIAKKNNPSGAVITGGAHPSAEPEQTLSIAEFDAIIMGEGEYAMLEFAHRFSKGGHFPKKIHHPHLRNLDELPLPARHLIDLNSYTRTVAGQKATTLITGRGCPYNCAFCFKDIFGNNLRFHSPERVVEEIQDIMERWNYRHFVFWDDIFTLNRKRLYKLCDMLKELNIVFRCNGRVGFNTYEDFLKLKEAGCKEIAFGIESGSQKMLDLFRKEITVEQSKQAIQDAQKAGLIVRAYLVVGFPGEDEGTIKETKRFIDEVSPDQFIVFTFVPFPGCDVWKHPEKYKVIIDKTDFSKFYTIAGKEGYGGIVFETENMTKDDFWRYREELISHLSTKKQRGELQPYMKKLQVYQSSNASK